MQTQKHVILHDIQRRPKLKRVLLVVAALLAVITATACSSNKNEGSTSNRDVITPGYASAPMTTSFSLSGKGETSGISIPALSITATQGADGFSTPTDRMIVRTGNISMVVDDVTGALANIAKIADTLKGYVVSSNSWKNGESVYGSITIRVPSESYDAASNSVTQIAVDVTSQSSSSQDVTEEYVDLGAQLSNLKATEGQLLLIMGKALKVEEILAVQAQLTQVQSQIAQIQGRMQYLEKTSATSLIDSRTSTGSFGF